jgi:4,5-dihydroxyphthalate decarboxylase
MPELQIAVTRNDRTLPLIEGKQAFAGLDVELITLPINEMFSRMLRSQDFAASEMSLAYAMLALDLGVPLVTLPVFLDRTFRHRDLYVRSDGSVRAPSDLVGRTFALPDMYSADGMWIRGLLRHGYGVEPREITWVNVRAERRLDNLPDIGYRLEPQPGANQEELLRDGKVDAMFMPFEPPSLRQGETWIRRLFAQPEAEEQAYYLRTGLFPMNHTLVMRRDLYEADPNIAVRLYEGFSQAREAWAAAGGSPNGTWEDQATDMWPYGVSRNHLVLKSAVEYATEDRMLSRHYEPEELFVEELRDT